MLGWGLPCEGNAEPMLSGKPVNWAVYSNDAVAAALSHMQMWDGNTSLGYVISKKTSVLEAEDI